MNKTYIIIAVVILAIAGYFLFAPKATQNNQVPETGDTGATGKLDINAVCEGALAYMTFTDGASADAYVAECKEGKHPEVIEKYKADMGLGDGAAI